MIRLRGHDGGICWVCLFVIGMLRGKMLQRCHVWTFLYTGVDCVPTFLYLRTLWFRFCYMFSVQVCVCPSFGRCWPSPPNVPAIDPGCLLAVFIFNGRFYFMPFFLHYGNDYQYFSKMFQDLTCHMRLVKGRFTFCSAQTNTAFVKMKLAAIIDQTRSILSSAPKLSFHFPT